MRSGLRRWISLFMTVILIVTSLSVDAFAASGKAAEAVSFDMAGPVVTKLPASRIEDLEGQEAVYFGCATADLSEKDACYSVPVYREGNLEEAATVSLLTLDVSALYGTDYELSAEDVFVAGDEQTLLQKSSGNNTVISDTEAAENVVAVMEEQTSEEEASEEEVSEEAGSDAEIVPGSLSTQLLDSIAGQTEASLTQQQVSELMSSDNLDFSAGTVLHFEPGVDELTLVFHVFEDELEEGQEMFQFVLADAEGTTVQEQRTLAVVINDNEELHDALISFSEDSFCSEHGEVTVTVQRSGSEYSMIDFYLRSSQDTAQPGTNYTEFNELISMQPYQTSASYTFDVRGTGRMEVVLVPSTACALSGSSTAEVLIDVTQTEEELEELKQNKKEVDILSASEDAEEEPTWQAAVELTEEEREAYGIAEGEKTFKITIGTDSTSYYVKYTGEGSDVTKGGIYDNRYDPHLKVGDYYFTTDKNCSYGHYDGDGAHRDSKYELNSNPHDARGHLYWYSGWCWRKGSSYFFTTCEIPSTYYRYVMPDWQGLHWACFYQTHEFKVKSGLGQLEKKIEVRGAGSRDGEFSRRVDDRVKIEFPYSWENTKLTFEPHTADRMSGATPKNGLNVYGFVCMYKAYDVKVGSYSEMNYRTAAGSRISSIPFRVHLQSGARSLYSGDQYHTIYADSEETQSQLVFSPAAIYLNGHSGIFGQITGYNITYNCESAQEKQKTLKYPEDFFAYMDAQTGRTAPGHDFISWTADSVNKRKEKAKESLLTVSFDRYLIDWLMNVGQSIYGPDATFGSEAVKLSFQPVFSYTDVNVTVLEPSYGSGKFKDSSLTVTGAGEKPHVYHAGDTLDLSVEALETDMIEAGYEVSYDNGKKFDTIVSTSQLFLDRDHPNVIIRPVISYDDNRIEIAFIGDAKKHVTVANLIDPEDLEDTEYEGKYLYDVNPDKSNVVERARPQVGQLYQLQITVNDKPAEEGYVYRVYVEDPVSQKLNSQMIPFVAKTKTSDNLLRIGVEKVKEDKLMDLSITGAVHMVPLRYLRDSAEARDGVPVIGYSVISFASQIRDDQGNDVLSMQQAETDKNGTFALAGLKAKAGDVIPVLITGGFGAGQMETIVVGYDSDIKAGALKVTYPYDAPSVTSVMYSYGNSQHNIDRDLNENTVNIYDDSLKLQITVDEKKRKVDQVLVKIVHYEGDDVETIPATRNAGTETGDSDVWEATILKMTRSLNPGDRVYVQLVDREKMKVLVNGKEKETSIIYPVMDTGLKFYTEFVPKVPQWFDASLDPTDQPINIPVMGKGNTQPGATSGLISWDSTLWEDGNGYTMTINLGVGLSSITAAIKANRYKTFEYNMKSALKEKKNAELIALRHLENTEQQQEILEKDINNLEKQLQKNKAAREAAATEMANPKGRATETYWTADATTLIALYFVKAGNDYVYAVGNVCFGFTGSIDYTKFVMFSFIPGYLNVGGVLQLSYSGQWSTPKGVQGLSAGVFQSKKGNLKEVIGTESGLTSGEFEFGIKAYGGVGAGAKGVVGAKGAIDITFKCGVPTPNPDKEQNGYLVDFGGGLTIDLLVTSLSINILRIRQGWGAWKDRSQISWFGHVSDYSTDELYTAAMLEEAGGLRSESILRTDGNELTSLVENLAGTSDMSGFGSGVTSEALLSSSEDTLYASPLTLLSDAADNPRLQSIETDDKGSMFLVYIGNRGTQENGSNENGNAEALYYTSYDANDDSWTTPELLDPDGTFDTIPSLTLANGVITVTWSSSQTAFDQKDTLVDKIAKLRIKVATFKLLDGGGAEALDAPTYLSGELASPSVATKKNSLLGSADTEETEVENGTATKDTAETEDAAEKRESDETKETAEITGIEETEEETKETLLGGIRDTTPYYDAYGQTWYDGDRLYSVFLRFDLSEVTSIEQVSDYSIVKPAAYLAVYNTKTKQLESLHDLKLTSGESLLMNAETSFIPVTGYGGRIVTSDRDFIVLGYIQDTDGDLETDEDNDLKLCLIELGTDNDGIFVYPAMDVPDSNGDSEYAPEEYKAYGQEEYETTDVSNDPDNDGIEGRNLSGAKITEADGTWYLTYLKEGYLFEMVDIGEYITEMFTFNCLAELYKDRAKKAGGGLTATLPENAATNGKPWFELSVSDLNTAWEQANLWLEDAESIGQQDDYSNHQIPDPNYPVGNDGDTSGYIVTILENSFLEDVNTGAFRTMETSISQSADEKVSLNDYQVLTNGTDMYVVYTDYPADRIQPSKELFCIKLNLSDKYGTDDAGEEDNVYYSQPVQLTGEGHVISSYAASMRDGVITVISDTYDQVIPEEGGIVYSKNSIVETKYKTKSILTVNEAVTGTEFAFSGEENGTNYVNVYYGVSNEGLESQEGYQTWVEDQNGKHVFDADQLKITRTVTAVSTDGNANVTKETTETKNTDRMLRSGQTDTYSFCYPLTGSGENEVLTVVVADADGITVRDRYELELSRQETLEIMDAEAVRTDAGYEAHVQVKNTGNVDTAASKIRLNRMGDNCTVEENYAAADVPALRAGQSEEIVLAFIPDSEDFTENGTINMEAALPEKDGSGYPIYYVAADPDMAEIENGKSRLRILTGTSRKLDVTAEPFSDNTGEVIFTSSNPAIISVSEDGTVTGMKNGSAVITAYLTKWGLSDQITVIASEEADPDDGDSSRSSLPSYVDQGGSWKVDSAGNWTYTTRAGVKVADRWMAIARSTFGGGEGFEWFRFDKDGNMVTGWFKDSDDRMYYLQIVSDGSKGRMMIGWQKIEGKWYYFNTVSDGYKGALYRNAVTPDGYTVGADGAWTGK